MTPEPTLPMPASRILEAATSRRVLVVDDETAVREVLAEGLEAFGYDTVAACDAKRAFEVVRGGGIGLVLSDIDMPGHTGLELLEWIKADYPDVDVVIVTGVVDVDVAIRSIRVGASDYVTKPFNLEEVRIVVERTLEKRRLILENRAYQTRLEAMVAERTAELEKKKGEVERLYGDLKDSYEQTLVALVTALDFRDNETQGHSWRVVEYSMVVAEAMGVVEPELSNIRRGAILHDVGKIGIPDAILRKPGKLDEAEWLEMRRHPEMGFRVLQGIKFLEPALPIVLSHQERWDGSGYPRGLTGGEIPLGARIFAVVDTFDAMTSDRPYRKALSIQDARDEVARFSGTQFDPAVAQAFLGIHPDRWRRIRERVHREVTAIEEQVRRALQ
jgi:response regulator RpfG family c-di-GMP phosphodiesterase